MLVYVYMETTYASPTTEHVENTKNTNERASQATFNSAEIDALRQVQRDTYDRAYAANIEDGFRPETAQFYANNSTSDVIDAHLHSLGIDRDHADYTKKHAALAGLSINAISDEAWAQEDDSGETYGQKMVRDTFGEEGLVQNDTPEAVDPALEAANKQLEGLRLAVAGLSAKRQGHLIGDGGKKYREAMAEYNEQVVKAGKIANAEVIASDELTDEEKNAKVISYLFEEQRKLREASLDSLKGTKVSKVIEWMNEGNFAVRTLKGVGVGAAAVVAGTVLTAGLGVAGIGAAAGVATAAVVGGARFARAFARKDAKGGRGMQQLDSEATINDAKQIEISGGDDSFEAIQVHFNDKFEEDTSKEQRKRLKSAMAGMAGIAIGGAIGTVAAVAMDSGLFDGQWNHNLNGETAGAGGQPEVTETIEPTPEIEEEITEPTAEEEPTTEPTGNWGPEIIPDPSFGIGDGEGGIHFFQRLGLTESDWYSVHEELLSKFPNEFYSESGDTRFAQSGQLSTEAQAFIQQRFGLA